MCCTLNMHTHIASSMTPCKIIYTRHIQVAALSHTRVPHYFTVQTLILQTSLCTKTTYRCLLSSEAHRPRQTAAIASALSASVGLPSIARLSSLSLPDTARPVVRRRQWIVELAYKSWFGCTNHFDPASFQLLSIFIDQYRTDTKA